MVIIPWFYPFFTGRTTIHLIGGELVRITLENIQGFYGRFEYEITDLITIINSKHNGVGKTTLFDCLRFLCDEALLDSEEREFMLNLNAQTALFSITVNEVTHGFAYMRGEPYLFFRIIDGEEMEKSETNFPNVGADIGVLQINDSLLNIFSKEVDLFSNSSAKENYSLIKSITTHEETEKALELLRRSEEVNKLELTKLRGEKKLVDSQIKNLSYYPNINQFEETLNSSFYIEVEDYLEHSIRLLSTMRETVDIGVSSYYLDRMDKINDLINQLVPTDEISLNAKPVEQLDKLNNYLEQLVPYEELIVSSTPIEKLVTLTNELESLVPTEETFNLSPTPIIKIEEFMYSLEQLQPIVELNVNTNSINKVSELCVSLAQMITQVNQVEYHESKLVGLRASMKDVRVACPIREEVYLINGKCHY